MEDVCEYYGAFASYPGICMLTTARLTARYSALLHTIARYVLESPADRFPTTPLGGARIGYTYTVSTWQNRRRDRQRALAVLHADGKIKINEGQGDRTQGPALHRENP